MKIKLFLNILFIVTVFFFPLEVDGELENKMIAMSTWFQKNNEKLITYKEREEHKEAHKVNTFEN